MFKKLITIIASTWLAFSASAVTWLQPSPNTIIGPRDVWYFANTNPVWMYSLWIGGNSGTNGNLWINGVLFDGRLVSNVVNVSSNIDIISSNLTTEINNRILADASLSNQIYAVSNAFIIQITNLQSLLQIETTNRINADSAISNRLDNLTNQINNTSNSLIYLIGVEATNRIDADSALSNLIANSSATNFGDIAVSNILFKLDGSSLNSTTNLFLKTDSIILSSNLINLVGLETTNRINADSALSNLVIGTSNTLYSYIQTETNNRIGADSALSNLIINTSNTLYSYIQTETNNRIGADSSLSNLISTVSNVLNNAIGLVQTNFINGSNSLNLAVGLETTNRINADSALSNQISTASNSLNLAIGLETTNRIITDSAISNLIINTSNTLNNYIGLVQTNFINGSNTLNNAIGFETTNRINSDSALSNLIINTSNTLNNAIGLETTNRINADSSLSNNIVALSNFVIVISNDLTLALGVETTNRINTDSAISNLIINTSNTLNNYIGLVQTNFINGSNSLNLAISANTTNITILSNYVQVAAIFKTNIFSGQVSGLWNNITVNDLSPTNAVNFNQYDITNVASLYLRGPMVLSDNTNSYIQFPPLSTLPAYFEGRMFYDTNSHTIAYYVENSGITMNIGQELWIRGKNTSGAIISNGQPVHVSGSIGNQDAQFDLAQATTNSFSDSDNAIGLATEDIAVNGFGYVCTYGVVHGLDTASYASGTPIYLSTNRGQLTQTRPPDGYTIRSLGMIIRSHANNGSILVAPRSIVDYSISLRLGLETTNRINADSSLSNQISTASNALNNAIGLETTNRINSDSAISNLINNTSNTLNNYIGLVQTNFINGSNSLNLAIGLETTNRIDADSALSNLVINLTNSLALVTTNNTLTSNAIPSLVALSNAIPNLTALSNSVADTITNLIIQYVQSNTNGLSYTNNGKIGYITATLTNGAVSGSFITNEVDPIFISALTNYLVTNIIFNSVSSSSNYIAFTTVSVGTAYIKYAVTNGASGGASSKSLVLNNFSPAQAQSVTGVVVSVFDNSGTDTDTITIPYVKSNETAFNQENLAQGVTQFVVWTNGYYGRFNVSNNHSKLQVGCVIKIGSDYYPIGSITNGGALSNSVYITAFLPPNTTQTVNGIYGTQFGETFLGLGTGSRSETPLPPYMSGEPFDYTTGMFGADDLGEWVFVNVINYSRQLGGLANPIREYGRATRIQLNSTNKLGWVDCPGFRDSTTLDYSQRYRTRDGKRVYGIYEANAQANTLYVSTNGLDTVTQIGTSLPVGYQGVKYWTCLESDRSNTVIYATAGGKVGFGAAGGYAATNMAKSTDGGTTWTVLSNMGKRAWSSITTIDGTQVWAVAQFVTGSSTGGIYASSDGGATCNYTNYASQTAFSPTDIYTADGTNIYIVCHASGGPAGQTASVFGYSTNSGVDWSWSAPFSQALCVKSFLNSKEVWTLAGSGNLNLSASTNYFNSVYSPNTNWAPYYKARFVPRSSYNYNVCFAPANPNIGYMVFQINGMTIYKTTDGGQTWSATASPSTDWQSVTTWDGNYVVAMNGAATAAGGAGNVYYSTNGGTTWAISRDGQRWCNLKLVMPCSNKVYALASLGGYAPPGFNYSELVTPVLKADTSDLFFSIFSGGIGQNNGYTSYNSVEFIDATNVLASGNSYNAQAGGAYPWFLQSRDSGDNWFLPHNMVVGNMQYGSSFNLSGIGTAYPIGIRSTTNNIIWVANGYVQAAGPSIQQILRYTNNNGVVSYINTPYGGTAINPQDIAPSPDGTRIYVACYTNNILVSTNSGTSWTTNDTRRNWSSITTADGLTVYACVYGGAIYVSTNSIQGTNTFTVLESTSRNYTSIYAPTTNIIIASIASTFGQDFLVSTNAGVNWVTNSSGLTRNWQRVTRIPSDTNNLSYLVMAYGNYLYKTTNLFQSVFVVKTNTGFGASSYYISDFDMPKLGTDTNLFFFSRQGGSTPTVNNLLKSQGDTILLSAIAPSLLKIWTALTTFDGKKLYAFSATQEKRVFQTTASAAEYGYAVDVDSGAYTQFTPDTKAWIGANMPTRNKLYMVTYSDLWQTDFDNVSPTNQFYSVINSNAVSSQYWIDINDTLATVNLPNDAVSTNLVLFSFSFDNNASYVKWNGTQWYAIATNNTGTWQYWGGSVWSNAYTNSIHAALSDAMSVSSNQMTYTDVTGIPDSGWEAASGFTTNFTTLYIGVTLSSTFYRSTPSISDFSFHVDKTGGLFSKKNTSDGTNYKIETTVTNNIQTVTKLGTNTVNAIIYYIGN